MSDYEPPRSHVAPETDSSVESSRRSRGGVVGWMSRHPVILAVMGLLLVLSMGVFAFGRNAENRYQKRICEIRGRGEPTTIEELLDTIPQLLDRENGLILALDSIDEIDAVNANNDQFNLLPWIGVADPIPAGARFTPEQSDAAHDFCKQVASPLARARSALDSGKGCHRPSVTRPMINMKMPLLSKARRLTKVLMLCAWQTAIEKNEKESIENMTAAIQLASMVDGSLGVITALVRIAIISAVQDQVERLVNLDNLSEESLVQLTQQLNTINIDNLMKSAYIAERVIFLDAIDWLQSNPSAVEDWKHHLPGVANLNAAEGIVLYEGMIAAAGSPTGASIKTAKVVRTRAESLPWYQIYAPMIVPSLSRPLQLWVRCIGSQRALITALACERYRLKHGAWPGTLDALVPEFLEAVPLDPFDEKPIRYIRIPEGIKVWSIGEDFVDNGGDIRRLDPDPKKRPTDWGWVILDPPLRNRPAAQEAMRP